MPEQKRSRLLSGIAAGVAGGLFASWMMNVLMDVFMDRVNGHGDESRTNLLMAKRDRAIS